MRRVLAAELFGTFCMVFAGTGAIVVNDVHHGVITHLGIALTFGLIVLAMIYALGDISGCHINPAVTLAFLAAGRMDRRLVIPYILAQLAGAALASLALRLMFPEHAKLGATLPADGVLQAWVMEFFLTLMLMAVILGVSSGAAEKGLMAGIAVGSVVALEAIFGGPVSGASMNPARSFGPVLVSGHWEHLWIYMTAPVAGAIAAVAIWKCIHDGGKAVEKDT